MWKKDSRIKNGYGHVDYFYSSVHCYGYIIYERKMDIKIGAVAK